MVWSTRKLVRTFTSLLAVVAVCGACGAGNTDGNDGAGNNDGGNDGGDGPLQISGQLTDYAHGEVEVSAKEDLQNLAAGTISADGSFTVTFSEGEAIDELLLPIDPDASGERFTAYPCQPYEDQPAEISDTDARLLAVTHFQYFVTTDGNSDPWAIALNDQTEGDVNIISPLPQSPEKRVMWIYADRAVQITGECTLGLGTERTATADLDLQKGWNEVNRDFEDKDRHHMWTGEQPENLGWHHGEITGGF